MTLDTSDPGGVEQFINFVEDIMKSLKILSSLAIVLIISSNIYQIAQAQTGGTPDSRLVAADNRFAFKLFDQIAKEDAGKNIFISPASISMALAMTYNGADGETKAAMTKVLELQGLSLDEINQGNAAMIKELADPATKVTLTIANSLWGRQEIEFRPEFLQKNKDFYQARIQSLDFNDPGAPNIINKWVSDNTKGRIPNIVGGIDPQTILFLINAIYFKGTWTAKFDSMVTKQEDFYPLKGGHKKVPMMSQSGKFGYFEGQNFQAINLPYGNKQISMYIFLPRKNVSLMAFQDSLTASNWEKWMHSMQGSSEGTIKMPRFKLEYEKSLNRSLGTLGMGIAFSEGAADFSPMIENNAAMTGKVFIKEVKHKTFVEVNEKGTEAAAVTDVEVSATAYIPKPPPFVMVVDHPFFYAIRDNKTGVLLFMGYVVDPGAK